MSCGGIGQRCLTFTLGAPEGSFRPPKRSLVIRSTCKSAPAKRDNGAGIEVPQQATGKSLDQSASGWMYDADSRTVWIKFPDPEKAPR